MKCACSGDSPGGDLPEIVGETGREHSSGDFTLGVYPVVPLYLQSTEASGTFSRPMFMLTRSVLHQNRRTGLTEFTRLTLLTILLASFALLLSATALASDWPQF